MPAPDAYGPAERLRGGAGPPDGFASSYGSYPWTPQQSPAGGSFPEECPIHIHPTGKYFTSIELYWMIDSRCIDMISTIQFPSLLLVDRLRLDCTAYSVFPRLGALVDQLRTGPFRLQKLVLYVTFPREAQAMGALHEFRQQREWRAFCDLAPFVTVDIFLETPTLAAFMAVEGQVGTGPPVNFVRRMAGPRPLPGELALPPLPPLATEPPPLAKEPITAIDVEPPSPGLALRADGKEAVVYATGEFSV